MSPRPFLLGDWRVEPSLNQLSRGSTALRVTPKAMEVLLVLASRSGDVVSRKELLDTVWSDVHVNEEVLTRAVADLRKVLDDDPKFPGYIATVPKRGYRLVAPLSEVDGGPRAARSHVRLWGALAALLAAIGLFIWTSRNPGPRIPLELESRPLTSLPGREVLPAISPDGGRVAFVWSGEEGDNWDVYVTSTDSETTLRLTEDPAVDASPAWSPDGKRIAFQRYLEGAPCRILEVDALGDEEREVGSCGNSQSPDLAWSPDGRYLAFSDRDRPSESFGIFLLSPSTGERRKLVAPEGQHWGDKDPAFSPDGRWLSFTRSVSMNAQDVFRVRVEGGVAERVTFDGREVRGHGFTPDGRELVISSARNGRLALWRFSLDGDEPRWLFFSGGLPRSPSVASSGELVFEERTRDSDIASVEIETSHGTLSALVSSTREESEPAVSPDGEKLAFVSTRSGFPEIWVADLAGKSSSPVRLTNFRGPHVGAPRWSPDGTRLVFDARPDGHADVFSVEAAGSVPRPLTSEPSNEIAPSYSPDGRYVLFGSDRSGTWQIWRAPADGRGRTDCVIEDGGYVARMSADAANLYFTKFDRPGLFRLRLASGEASAVQGAENLSDPSLWETSGEELFFVTFEAAAPALHLMDLSTGATRKLSSLDDVQPGGGLSFDRQRGRVLFTRTVRTESDLILSRLR